MKNNPPNQEPHQPPELLQHVLRHPVPHAQQQTQHLRVIYRLVVYAFCGEGLDQFSFHLVATSPDRRVRNVWSPPRYLTTKEKPPEFSGGFLLFRVVW